MKHGDAGQSATEAWYVDSIEEAELGYLMCRAEKVGVTGEAASEVEEVCVWAVARSASESDMLSLFLRSSTSCGSSNGLSFGDMWGGFAPLRVLGWVQSRSQGFVDGILPDFMVCFLVARRAAGSRRSVDLGSLLLHALVIRGRGSVEKGR